MYFPSLQPQQLLKKKLKYRFLDEITRNDTVDHEDTNGLTSTPTSGELNRRKSGGKLLSNTTLVCLRC